MNQPKLLVIVASTRPGRVGRPVADWFLERAAAHAGFAVEEVDLKTYGLPPLDEPNHPRLRQYTQEHTRRWSATVEAADAFVWITPEYNHSYPASLKNAIDYLLFEWSHKPLGFVSYGGIAGGTRSVQALKPVATALQLTPASVSVNIPFVAKHLEGGTFRSEPLIDEAAQMMLDELLKLAGVLVQLRAPAD